jgi:hypothetical protein
MSRQNLLIRYSNGFKRHVSKTDLDLLGETVKQIGPREYLSTVSFQTDLDMTSGPNFLSGRFVIEYPRRLGGGQVIERLETTKGMIGRLTRAGALAGNQA